MNGGRKIIVPRISQKADHPSAMFYPFSLIAYKGLHLSLARIFLVLLLAESRQEDPST